MPPTSQQFGLVIAYLLPGFIALGGVALLIPTVGHWLRPSPGTDGSWLGPPVYAILAAIAAGMIISCLRWLFVDHLLLVTGVPKAAYSFDGLSTNLGAVDYLLEGHYRFYQSHANTLVAVVWTYSLARFAGALPHLGFAADFGVIILCAVLLAGARDALIKYRRRVSQVLSQSGPNPQPRKGKS